MALLPTIKKDETNVTNVILPRYLLCNRFTLQFLLRKQKVDVNIKIIRNILTALIEFSKNNPNFTYLEIQSKNGKTYRIKA